jgi:hypothetical protein
MHHMKNILSVLVVIVILPLQSVAGVSGNRQQAYEKVTAEFSHVFVLKVTKMSTGKTHRHYANGKTTLEKETITIDGTIERELRGSMVKKTIRLMFENRPPVLYDDEANLTLGALVMSFRSGIEFQAKVGESYIFSLQSVTDGSSRHRYTRMDSVEHEQAIKSVLANYSDASSDGE